MIFLPAILATSLILSLVFVIRFLYNDRESWRTRYFDLLDGKNAREETLISDTREREKYLFDEILKAKQIRPVALKDKELPKPQAYVSPDEIAMLVDRIGERVEAGVMTELEASVVLADVRSGKRTQAEVDRDLWTGQANLPGSVLEPI